MCTSLTHQDLCEAEPENVRCQCAAGARCSELPCDLTALVPCLPLGSLCCKAEGSDQGVREIGTSFLALEEWI